MKVNKKLFAVVCAAMMLATSSVSAFAAGGTDYQLEYLSIVQNSSEENLVKAYIEHEDGTRTELPSTFKLQKVINDNRAATDMEQYVLTGEASTLPKMRGGDAGDDVSSKLDARITASIYFTHFLGDLWEGEQYRLDSAYATFEEGQDVHMSKQVILRCGQRITETVNGSDYERTNIGISGPRAFGTFVGNCSSWGTTDTLVVELKSPAI